MRPFHNVIVLPVLGFKEAGGLRRSLPRTPLVVRLGNNGGSGRQSGRMPQGAPRLNQSS